MQKITERELFHNDKGAVVREVIKETQVEGCDSCGRQAKCCQVDPKDLAHPLSYLSALTAIRSCINESGLRIGMFTQTSTKCNEVFRWLTGGMDADEKAHVLRISSDSGSKCVQFKNGSYIKVLDAYQNFRGYTFDKVLFDDDIEDETVDRALRWALRTKGGEDN